MHLLHNEADLTLKRFKEIKHHFYTANSKRKFVPRDQVFPLSFTVHYGYTKIGRFMPALSIRIVLSCFHLFISYFENFST